MSRTEIFLSYAWGGDSEMIVNELDNAFKAKEINLTRDKRDLGFKGMITEFMQRIGKGQAVVVVISDKYLKSPYCMFELLEIYRNLDFKERIFPIILEDANIFDPVPRLGYLRYWQDKKKELDDAIMKFGADAIDVIGDDYKTYKKIFEYFGEFANILKDINSLTPDMHRADHFTTLIDAVEKLISKDRSQHEDGTEPINWKFIVRQVEKQKCILFLGPELFRTDGNELSRQQVFFEALARNNPHRILSYNDDGFFMFSSPEEKTRLFKEIRDFFEEQAEDDLIRKIAEIPFHVTVSINPDILLRRFFLQKNQAHVFEYFDKKIKKDLSEAPSLKKPLIYNLFGSVTNLDTLILTHDDLFEYFRALMGNNVLPQELRTALETATNYVFLGFQFDKWYIQLILSLLKLNDKQYNFIRYASANTLGKDAKTLCINHYRIQFIGADNNEFINTLHEKCGEAGLLRDFQEESGANIADEKERELKDSIERENKLLQEYESLQNYEKDPIKLMDIEDNIEDIRKKIAQYEKELESIPVPLV
jgi:hypothetical protein